MQMNLEELDYRFNIAETKALSNNFALEALYTYVIPDRKGYGAIFNGSDLSSLRFFGNCLDSTAVIAAGRRAEDLQGVMTPAGRKWGKIGLNPIKINKSKGLPTNKELAEDASFQAGIDAVNEMMHIYLNRSNLAKAVAAANLDFIAGTGAIWVESKSDDEPLIFKSIPLNDLVLEYSMDDMVDTCWFTRCMSARRLLELYPNYPDTYIFKDKINDDLKVIFGQVKYFDKKSNRYKYYIYSVLKDNPTKILWDVTRNYKQLIIFRDRILPGNVFGFGIGMALLPDIWRLNHSLAMYHENITLMLRPPTFVDNDLAYNPAVCGGLAGKMIPRMPGSNHPLEIMPINLSPIPLHDIETAKARLERNFEVNLLGDVGGKVPTATEVAVRQEIAQRRSNTDIARLVNEQPKQIYEVSFEILNERGFFRKILPKRFLSKIDVFVNPLEDLQKKADVAIVQGTMQFNTQIGGPSFNGGIFNMRRAGMFIAMNNGVPANLLNTDKEAEDYFKALQQQQQSSDQRLLTSADTESIPITAKSDIPIN